MPYDSTFTVARQAALQPQPRHPERLVLVVALRVGEVVRRLADAPLRPRLPAVLDLPGDRGIVLHPHGQEDAVRAEPTGRDDRHGAMDAKGAGLIRRRRDDATALHAAADDDRLAPQLRPVALLDGRVEGVHVGMQDRQRR